MTTTPLIPATARPTQETPVPSASPQTDSPAFRDVLASQTVPPQEATARKDGAKDTAPSGKSPSGGTASPGKPAQAGKKADDKKLRAADEPTAPGPSLPGIALYIAAESNAALSHPAPGGETKKTADVDQEAGSAKPARPGSISLDPATPGAMTSAAAFLARPAAGANAQSAKSEQTGTIEEARAETTPKLPATHGASQATPSHDRTSTAATVPVPSPAKATNPAALLHTAQGNDPSRAISDPTRRTLVHTASDSAPTLLAAMPAAATTPPSPSATLVGAAPAIPVPLQSPYWPGELGRQFVAIVQSSQPGQGHSAQLRLDPPNLGPLHIAIHVSDNVAQAVFFSPHAQVRQAVENALPQLQQQLAQAGIALGQASVSDQGTPQQAFDDETQPLHRRASGTITAMAVAPSHLPPQARPSTGNALVDTFA